MGSRPRSWEDSRAFRQYYFRQCLNKVGRWMRENEKDKTQWRIAIPFLIGCGLAGGKEETYTFILKQFMWEYGIDIVAYKLNDW